MLYYDIIDISEGIDPTKDNKSRERMICHHFCFNHRFKFQDYICNGCHNFTMSNVNISHNIKKFEAFYLLKFLFLKIVCA